MADVDLKEVGEEIGSALEGAEGSGAEGGVGVHQEHGAGHERGRRWMLPVGALVGGEIFCSEGMGECEGLTEAEGEAFACDGVDGAGGVTDEGDVAGGDAVEAAGQGDGAAGGVGGRGGCEAELQGREEAQGLLDAGEFFGGYEGDADFVGRDGGDVGLGVVGPVDFDEVCPGGDGEVLAEAYAAGAGGGSFEAGAGADAGLGAVGADDPAGAEGFVIGVDLVVVDGADYGLPVELDTEGGGSVEEELVEESATYAATGDCWEGGFSRGEVAVRGGVADESDATEEGAFGWIG